MKITDAMIRRSCSSTIYKRGMEYFKEGRVHLQKRSDSLITAVVDGESLYNVSVKFDRDGNITDTFCTCPYYETMHSTCKHIVAALRQRMAEQDENGSFSDENDKLAMTLCKDFADKKAEKQPLELHFILYINNRATPSFAMALEIGKAGTALHGIENFLDFYAKNRPFKFSRSVGYDPASSALTPAERALLNILAEAYENRAGEMPFYTKASYQTQFGSATLKRILPLLPKVHFSLMLNGIRVSDIRFLDEDPDIIIDVRAVPGEITLTVSDKGFALTRDGAYFLYDNIIYHTTEAYRSYFMPIYNALNEDSRTQISFRGENTMLFAAHVLPALQKMHGVVSQGIDDLIINERPVFTVYFDAQGNSIRAAVVARYGTVSLQLGAEEETEKRIVVRDSRSEDEILSFFADFIREKGSFCLDDDEKIFTFLKYALPRLAQRAELVYSDAFRAIEISDTAGISAGVHYNRDINLLEADFSTDLETEEIYGILAAVKLKEHFYRRSDGSFISLDDNDKKYIFNLLEQLEFSPSDVENRSKQLPKYHALYLNALDGIEKDDSFLEYIENIKKIQPNIPEHLENTLRFYQKDGIRWLKQLSELGLGGILADDMGLGKTLQVLAFVEGEHPEMPALVVAPSALTYNWYNECCRFTPELRALIVDGTKDERAALIAQASDYDLIITSYPILRRDIALYRQYEFSYCFIDEAQYIKNPKTMNARSVKRIRAARKFALTGTPIENSLSELWSIFDFIMSGYLYDLRTFRSVYETPIVKDGDDHVHADFKAKIKPFILRRMKSEVLSELPEKMEYTVYADLTPEQRKMYASYLALAKNRTLSLLQEGGRNKIQILTLLMRLRQICCHPSLFDENYTYDSGKLQLLLELAESATDAGHRLLIFSQYTSMLEIIREELNKKSLKCFYLDGKTPSYERSEMADRFNGGERDIFLISLRAGGTGLNLTGADMVIHYDPWWNPATMDQASDRAYRIGQTRNVQVIRLAAKGTIEEKILKLQEAKRSLADGMITANNETFAALTNEEILSLFE